jgi:bifunctional DNA-binding transcriptional regulator/antitoxin component of YhaV-PrlF toxin-antitoxin module
MSSSVIVSGIGQVYRTRATPSSRLSLADRLPVIAPDEPRQGLMLAFMNMASRMKISKGGQISIPAPIRHRWATSTVTLRDEGERIVLEPAPDDPIAAAEGALAAELGRVDLTKLRRAAREDERAAAGRRAHS